MDSTPTKSHRNRALEVPPPSPSSSVILLGCTNNKLHDVMDDMKAMICRMVDCYGLASVSALLSEPTPLPEAWETLTMLVKENVIPKEVINISDDESNENTSKAI